MTPAIAATTSAAPTHHSYRKSPRPETLKGCTRRIQTPLGMAYVTITEDDGGHPFEVFISLGKAGGPLNADVEAIGRLISLGLRSGIPLEEIRRQLRGISSDRAVGLGANKVASVPDAIGIALEKWMAGSFITTSLSTNAVDNPPPVAQPPVEHLAGACPECGSQLEFAEGCSKCRTCGHSECG